ncbi:hypothetical protein JCM8547_009413 [Rhodosporidiobolus lusitaniae]
MPYASSNSSVESRESFTFDPFAASFSFSPSSSAGGSTSPSSVASASSFCFEADDSYFQLRTSSDAFVQHLLKNKKENETALAAWRVRCETLEGEVLRLSNLVAQLERDAVRVREEAHSAVVNESPHPSVSTLPPAQAPCDCSPDCASSPTACILTPLGWQPLPPPSKPTIDPTKPMSRQNPPPCNSFFLLGHCDVPRCRFEHGYELTEDQIAEMRRGAKHHVCNAIRNGVPCPDGEDCIYGHFCQRGPSCGRDRCGFNDEQHRIIPGPRPIVRRRS